MERNGSAFWRTTHSKTYSQEHTRYLKENITKYGDCMMTVKELSSMQSLLAALGIDFYPLCTEYYGTDKTEHIPICKLVDQIQVPLLLRFHFVREVQAVDSTAGESLSRITFRSQAFR